MRYYIFNTNSSQNENLTVIVDFQLTLKYEDIRNEFVQFHKDEPRLNSAIYIGPKFENYTQEEIINNLSDILNKPKNDISLLMFNEAGIVNDNNINYSWILNEGILNIVKKRSAIIFSDSNFHFELPSGKHSPYLIRTANILSHSEEIHFLSLCLLDKIQGHQYRRIVCDSSSIMHLAFGLKHLKSLFQHIWDCPVESFFSYKFKDNGYVFKPNSLVLISASNSGNLENYILSSGEIDLNIITVLLNNSEPNEGQEYLFNLHQYKKDIFNELSRKEQYVADKCKYCDNHSILVKVHGEQFLPSKTTRKQRVLSLKNKPKWLNRVVENLKDGEGIVCYRGEKKGDKKYREIFIDAESLFTKSNIFKKQFNKYIENFMPSKVDLIVYNPDKNSKLVAKKLEKYYNEVSKTTLLPMVDILSLPTEKAELTMNIIVVCASITTGNQFNSVSRKLREFKNSSLHYFTLFSKLSNRQQLEILKSNLEYRSENKNTCVNKLHTVFEGYLPDINSQKRNKYSRPNWQNELEFWELVDSPPSFILRRMEILKNGNGLIDDLFLLNPFSNEKLFLRPNFAFYDFKKHKPTQAMVFYIMSSILHNSRSLINSLPDDTEVLINHEHSHSVISLECFKRFNDGVIQASLLRAALPIELDYSCTEEISREALRTFKDLFKNSESTQDNEGIMEFLLALVTNKMKLQNPDKIELIQYLKSKYKQNAQINFMLSLV